MRDSCNDYMLETVSYLFDINSISLFSLWSHMTKITFLTKQWYKSPSHLLNSISDAQPGNPASCSAGCIWPRRAPGAWQTWRRKRSSTDGGDPIGYWTTSSSLRCIYRESQTFLLAIIGVSLGGADISSACTCFPVCKLSVARNVILSTFSFWQLDECIVQERTTLMQSEQILPSESKKAVTWCMAALKYTTEPLPPVELPFPANKH